MGRVWEIDREKGVRTRGRRGWDLREGDTDETARTEDGCEPFVTNVAVLQGQPLEPRAVGQRRGKALKVERKRATRRMESELEIGGGGGAKAIAVTTGSSSAPTLRVMWSLLLPGGLSSLPSASFAWRLQWEDTLTAVQRVRAATAARLRYPSNSSARSVAGQPGHPSCYRGDDRPLPRAVQMGLLRLLLVPRLSTARFRGRLAEMRHGSEETPQRRTGSAHTAPPSTRQKTACGRRTPPVGSKATPEFGS